MINKSRKIIERIIVEGDLVLLSPTSLGNGDRDGLTDMSLLFDETEEKALLTGTSIAGALRSYLREREEGFEIEEGENSNTRKLFGYHEDDSTQSYLIIDDALSNEKPATELRDGVRIEGKTRTAESGKKYDFELLEGGTTFKLRFELLICKGQDRDKLVSAFAIALQGFENGEIRIGARKRRGFGECKVDNWKIQTFDLQTKDGLQAWLRHNPNKLDVTGKQSISVLISQPFDKRAYFELSANFAIDGSVLIRSGSKISENSKYQPDTVHLRSNGKPVISGTSLAGVLRHRAFKIINTLSNETEAKKMTDKMFGDEDSDKKDKSASRLEVKEAEIENTHDLIQTRVKIDRFTGGAMDTALFDAAPVFSDGERNAVNIKLRLRNAEKGEIGLLLLLLKDLWTSDLAIGGESSVGRGRLKGKTACLNYKNSSSSWHLNMEAIDEKRVKIDGIENNTEKITLLNKFVGNFNESLITGEQQNVEYGRA